MADAIFNFAAFCVMLHPYTTACLAVGVLLGLGLSVGAAAVMACFIKRNVSNRNALT